MSSPSDEIEALKIQIAALTARVYHLEQHSTGPLEEHRQGSVSGQSQEQPLPAGEALLKTPSAPIVSSPIPVAAAPFLRDSGSMPSARENTDLEKKRLDSIG
jgi:hypothetical protein